MHAYRLWLWKGRPLKKPPIFCCLMKKGWSRFATPLRAKPNSLKFKPIIEEFRNAVFPHGLPSSSKWGLLVTLQNHSWLTRRKMNPPENGPSSKRQRVEDLPDLDWVKACETGYVFRPTLHLLFVVWTFPPSACAPLELHLMWPQVETLKVDQLKAFLRNQSVHFSSKSRKADLVTAVKAHVLSNAFNPTRK